MVQVPALSLFSGPSCALRKRVKSDVTLDVHPSSGMRKQKALDLFVGLPAKANLCRRLADVRKVVNTDLTLDVHPNSGMRKQITQNLFVGLPTKANLCHLLANVRKGVNSDLTLDVRPSSEMRKQKALDPAPLGVCSKACCHFVLFPFIKTNSGVCEKNVPPLPRNGNVDQRKFTHHATGKSCD